MPDNKEISALTTAEQTSNNDLFETSIPNAMTDTGYISRKQSVTMLEQQMLGNTQYNTELPNFTAGNRTIFKALEEARSSGGGGASVIQKTMAEYTALPSADKMNGSIYKITDKALIYCLDEEYHAVLEITSADYAQLTSDEKNNGTLYIITDEETTAADIPYSSGVSVADKLDSLATVETVSITKTIVSRGSVECFKIGRIVQVCININTDSVTSPVGTEIARGLPIPISYSGLYPRLFGGQKIQNVVIDNNGYLKTVDTSMDGATWWAGQIIYFAQS